MVITVIHEVRWLPNDVEAKLDRLSNQISQTSEAINNLTRKVETMSSNLDRIEKEAADAAENVGLVRTAIEDLRSASAAMQAEIASLKEQVAQGQLDQARLDAAAATFEKADDDIDAIVLPGGATGNTDTGDTTGVITGDAPNP